MVKSTVLTGLTSYATNKNARFLSLMPMQTFKKYKLWFARKRGSATGSMLWTTDKLVLVPAEIFHFATKDAIDVKLGFIHCCTITAAAAAAQWMQIIYRDKYNSAAINRRWQYIVNRAKTEYINQLWSHTMLHQCFVCSMQWSYTLLQKNSDFQKWTRPLQTHHTAAATYRSNSKLLSVIYKNKSPWPNPLWINAYLWAGIHHVQSVYQNWSA